METTKLIVEYIVAGVIILLALALLFAAIFPEELQLLISYAPALQGSSTVVFAAMLAVVLTSLAYGIGVITEYLGVITFEWLLERVKVTRIKRFFQTNWEWLQDDAVLRPYGNLPPEKISRKTVANCHGEMRFDVLMQNAYLYAEIESQMNRFKLIRIFFIAEVILAVALLILIAREASAILISLLIMVILFGCLNWLAIYHRFNMYCRSIERSYKVLFLNSLSKNTSSQPKKTQPATEKKHDSVVDAI